MLYFSVFVCFLSVFSFFYFHVFVCFISVFLYVLFPCFCMFSFCVFVCLWFDMFYFHVFICLSLCLLSFPYVLFCFHVFFYFYMFSMSLLHVEIIVFSLFNGENTIQYAVTHIQSVKHGLTIVMSFIATKNTPHYIHVSMSEEYAKSCVYLSSSSHSNSDSNTDSLVAAT
jgi:hypothetical protein